MMFSRKPPIQEYPEVDNELDESLIEQVLDDPEDSPAELSASPTFRKPLKPTIISEGFEFVGSITSEGTVHIAGIVKGVITAKSVLVDVEGMVDGEMTTDNLMLKGSVNGEVLCNELTIGPRAMMDGNISYQNIHIQRCGKVSGTFNKRRSM